MTALHHALALIEAHPLLALPEAAERIADHTGADLVGCAHTHSDALPTWYALTAHRRS